MPACLRTDVTAGSCEEIEFRREGAIAHVKLNRPAKLNALTDRMEHALRSAWETINHDSTIHCVVLSGAGDRAFCVGADISGEHGDSGLAFGGGLTGVGGPLAELQKPLIAAVHGYCLGGGFELAMCADIIVAADSTVFGLPETRAGIIDHCGVVHRAVRRLPYAVAMAMILAGERLLAVDAARYGLVNAVVPADRLDSEAMRYASDITACQPGIAVAAKAAVRRGLALSLADALARRYPEIDDYLASR